jgi:membrane-anchored protein YejM (alkaline phosphatase superfamily)
MTHVAQDYNMRLYNSMKFASNPVYAKTLQDVMLSQKTKVKSQDWQWCERLNGTYLDCPVSQNPQSNFLIAAHNPSMLNQSYIKAKVSHGNYAVKVWDQERQVFVAVSKAAVICVMREVESGDLINDCDLHVKT